MWLATTASVELGAMPTDVTQPAGRSSNAGHCQGFGHRCQTVRGLMAFARIGRCCQCWMHEHSCLGVASQVGTAPWVVIAFADDLWRLHWRVFRRLQGCHLRCPPRRLSLFPSQRKRLFFLPHLVTTLSSTLFLRFAIGPETASAPPLRRSLTEVFTDFGESCSSDSFASEAKIWSWRGRGPGPGSDGTMATLDRLQSDLINWLDGEKLFDMHNCTCIHPCPQLK